MIHTPIIPTIGMVPLDKATDVQLVEALMGFHQAGMSLLAKSLLHKRVEYEAMRLMARDTLREHGVLEVPAQNAQENRNAPAGDSALD
jgi:4'-phosphopantetheinyl transferase EntD